MKYVSINTGYPLMKQRVLLIVTVLIALVTPVLEVSAQTQQVNTTQSYYNLPIDPLPCNKLDPALSCPVELTDSPLNPTGNEYLCATSYADFLTDPINKHYWIEDPAITAQGKADERARQFLYWVLNTNAVDEAPVLRTVWNVSSMIALFGIVLTAAIFGIGYILSTRTNYNFDFKIRIWPTVIKLGTMLLYVAFSSAIVFVLIQFSEVSMRFFYENLGGKDLFNIYFVNPNDATLGGTERSYTDFVGCRDLNIRVQEGIDTEVFMLKATNVSYYVLGTMLLLRKILLWFLLFVSPFLALLMPFILIRNTGWIWIGVFFQWLFYGPLVALFLGATSQIWGNGIPFSFDFSRVGTPEGYVYPTGINIVYGGPAQRLADGFNRPIGALNNANYIDTFAEYVLTLIMLWAVTFFPWWLLRIFRDYCCEGIYAMKNILLALYDHLRGGPPSGPSPSRPPTLPSMKLDTKTPMQTDIRVSLGSMEQIRKTMTGDIAKNMNIHATKITDIARVETNKQMNQIATQNLTYLANPVKASVPAQRQQYMNLRSELFARAIKNDTVARTILASTSTSAVEKARIRETLIRSIPQANSLSQMITTEVHVPKEQVTTITNTYTQNITNNAEAIESISQATQTPPPIVTNILNAYSKYTAQPIGKIVKEIAREQNTKETTVREVLRESGVLSSPARIVDQVATTQKMTRDQVSKVIHSIRSSVTRENSTLETITTTTQLSPPQIQQTMKSLISTVTENNELMTQVSPGLPPVTVKAILDSFTVNLSQPANRLVEKIALDTKIERTVVSSVLNNTFKELHSSETIRETAEKMGVPPATISTMIDTVTQNTVVSQAAGPAIESLSTQVQSGAAVKPDHIQTVIHELFQNPEVLSQVSRETQISETQVKQALSSYTTHMNQSSRGMVQSIAQEINLNQQQVQSIIQSVSSVSSSPQILTDIAQSTHIKDQTVKQIAQSLPATVRIKTAEPTLQKITPASDQSITHESIHSLFQTLSTDTSFVTQIAGATQLDTQTVQSILTVFDQSLDQDSSTIFNSTAEQTHTSVEQVKQVIQQSSHTLLSSEDIQNTLSQQTHTSTATVQHIAHALNQAVETPTAPEQPVGQQITAQFETSAAPTRQSISTIVQTIATHPTIISSISEQTHIDQPTVQNALQTFTTNLSQTSSDLVQTIATSSQITEEQVQTIMDTASEVIRTSPELVSQIAQSTDTTQTTVEQIASALPTTVQTTASTESDPLIKVVSSQTSISEQDSQQIIHNLMTSAIEDTAYITHLAETTHLKPQQIKNVLTTYANTINQPMEQIINTVNQASGIPKENVQMILITLTDSILASDQIVSAVAAASGVKESDVSTIMEKQMEFATEPEKHIEKTIAIPQSISLEDYEQVKDMWTKHYEAGEVPVSDTMKTRKEWVEQEIVYITNTLNKILSPDEKLQQEGLDELGYLLPIFLINNLKGEELIVYLKAKLEAAKMVLKILEREEAVKEEMKQEEEEEVFVDVKKEEETAESPELHMTMDEDEEAPKGIEDRVKAVQEKLQSVEDADQKPEGTIRSLSDIKSRLEDAAEK